MGRPVLDQIRERVTAWPVESEALPAVKGLTGKPNARHGWRAYQNLRPSPLSSAPARWHLTRGRDGGIGEKTEKEWGQL